MSKDMHSEMIREFEQMLIDRIPDEQIEIAVSCIILIADKYEVQDRCTDVAVVDTNNEYFIKAFLAQLRTEGKREKTIAMYQYTLRSIDDYWRKPFTEIQENDVRKFIAYLMVIKRVSNTTAENHRAVLSSFYRWMSTMRLIQWNPMDSIKPIKCHKKKEEKISATDMATLRDTKMSIKTRAVLEFLYATGVRVEELVKMDRKDVNLQTMEVHVVDGKGGKERTTYITPVATKYLIEYLQTRKDTHEALFLSHHKERYTTDGIREMLRTLGETAGVPNIHPHRLRRTFASNLADMGMPIQYIQILMGHSSVETTQVYLTTTNASIKRSYMQMIT